MPSYTLTIDLPEADILRLTLQDNDSGARVATQEVIFRGHVDNVLLTTVDELLKRHTIDKSVLTHVRCGQGIDKNSTLSRIVQSFASAVSADPSGS